MYRSVNACSPYTRLKICPWSKPTTNNPAANTIAKARIPKTGIVDFIFSIEVDNKFCVFNNYITYWINYPIYILNNTFQNMKQSIKTLQKVVKRKGSSKTLSFSIPHILKSIFYMSNQKYVSRSNFCKEIQLGEGAVKTLILHMKEEGLVETIKSGTFLTKKGQKIAEKFHNAIPAQGFLKKCNTTKGKFNYVIRIKKEFTSNLGNGMQQRDYAILYGASDSLTLHHDKKEFFFIGDKMKCFDKEDKTRTDLINNLTPNNGDVIIITSSDDKFVAEISAINTAIWTINN